MKPPDILIRASGETGWTGSARLPLSRRASRTRALIRAAWRVDIPRTSKAKPKPKITAIAPAPRAPTQNASGGPERAASGSRANIPASYLNCTSYDWGLTVNPCRTAVPPATAAADQTPGGEAASRCPAMISASCTDGSCSSTTSPGQGTEPTRNLRPLLEALDLLEGAVRAPADGPRTQIDNVRTRLRKAERHTSSTSRSPARPSAASPTGSPHPRSSCPSTRTTRTSSPPSTRRASRSRRAGTVAQHRGRAVPGRVILG
ncbi:hypothetical protein BJY27_002565 [Streptomyces rapamycinicus]|uniref:Uncharacterized protein n=2 Tax=Streptomyces rapamycinicus TaxID=1226757 RepID=A0A3L8R260_STRRN|nr:hypothetical protein [Streptomyces rapamycinicus]RLV73755.1 hypothetical protein D3C57_131055 [Streptomyces rapamycinicus NRRL 5491]